MKPLAMPCRLVLPKNSQEIKSVGSICSGLDSGSISPKAKLSEVLKLASCLPANSFVVYECQKAPNDNAESQAAQEKPY